MTDKIIVSKSELEYSWFNRITIEQSTLHNVLEYDKETGIFKWKKNVSRWKAGMEAGSINVYGRLTITINRQCFQSHRLAWIYCYGEIPIGYEIDHINNIPTDNRISNLRLATREGNTRNRGKQKNNKSGYKGVSYRKDIKKYTAQINANGKRKRIGNFDCPIKAYEAYTKVAKEIHGEFYKG